MTLLGVDFTADRADNEGLEDPGIRLMDWGGGKGGGGGTGVWLAAEEYI